MADPRNTQEMVGDFFAGITSLGASGVEGMVMARTVIRLLIEHNVITRDEYIDTMTAIVREELERDDNTTFLVESLQKILMDLESSN